MRSLIIGGAFVLLSNLAHAVNITANSWLVADGNGSIIESSNIEQVRPIASISKLMTAMIVLDAHQDLNEKIGQQTRLELINLALVKSDNRAADELCNHYIDGRKLYSSYECQVKILRIGTY